MNLLEEIQTKIKSISDGKIRLGVKAAVHHIEIAEKWFQNARNERSSDMFNDVIYRSNQAFEGMLKEAYSVLKKKDASKLTPNQIEQALKKDSVFTSRVMGRFENYRTEWRNPSTHDHKLLFTEQEALLAIISVSAFALILVDQLIESIGYESEKEQLKENREEILKRIGSIKGKNLFEIVHDLLFEFGSELHRPVETSEMKDMEMIGRLAAFMENINLGLTTSRETESSTSRRLSPDLIVTRGEESIIVELKSKLQTKEAYSGSLTQIQRYLEISGISEGIIYVPPLKPTTEMETSLLLMERKMQMEYKIYLFAPKDVLKT